ncbi:hypothetical protein OPT61_g5387 [Boeremia exigua]|uniref:Uncharacterized protein n=1 Tax=Boeremia exigua TaxID=749465 RepID=A0ACC2IAJ2_9PLEO|nr:hypothetical protein OPT61_g5387 [Boeremia exigua]
MPLTLRGRQVPSHHPQDDLQLNYVTSCPLTLHLNPPPLLGLAPLKHKLHAGKQRKARSPQESPPRPRRRNPLDQPIQPVQAQRKTHQIGHHQHENLADGAHAAQHAVQIRIVLEPARRKQIACDNLRQHEQRDQPAPHKQAQLDVVPYGDEREDSKIISDRPRLPPGPGDCTATQRNVQIPQRPLIKRAVPAAPKLHHRVVIAHAAHHVLGRVDAVQQRPEAEEAPGDQQLEPDVLEVEEAQHAELGGGHDDEADGVQGGAAAGDTVGAVAGLGDVVVEGEDGAGEVEGRVHGVGEVVAEGEVVGLGGDGDAVALGEVGGVELLLLDVISLMGGLGVEVEADQTEDREVEEDVPAGDQSAVAVERVAEVAGWEEVAEDGRVVVAVE